MRELTQHHLAAAPAIENILATVTAAAVELIDGVDCANVMLVRGEQVESRAPTAPLVIDLGAAQLALREGPCLEAARRYRGATSGPDPGFTLARFAATAIEAAVHRMLFFPLYRDRLRCGRAEPNGPR